jgi:hypothetical protein
MAMVAAVGTAAAGDTPETTAAPGSLTWSEQCRVPGCKGVLYHDTDNNGSLLSWCPDCEGRLKKLRLLRGVAPPRRPVDLTDVELLQMVRARFGTIQTILRDIRRGHNAVVHAIETGNILSIRVSGRARLVSIASARAWAAATARKPKPAKQKSLRPRSALSATRIAALPRSAAEAVTVKALLSRLPDDTPLRLGVWLAQNRGRPQLRREGTPGRYTYWWNEEAR